MALHTVKGSPPGGRKRMYATPAAFSIITGLSYEQAILALDRATSGDQSDPHHHYPNISRLRTALAVLGWQLRKHAVAVTDQEAVMARLDDCREPKNPSFAMWLKLRGELKNETVVVAIRGHLMVVRGRKAADNFKPEPVFISKMHFRRAQVREVWVVLDRRDEKRAIDEANKRIADAKRELADQLADIESARQARQQKRTTVI